MAVINEQGLQQITEIIKQPQMLAGAMLPILHAIQNSVAFIPDNAIGKWRANSS